MRETPEIKQVTYPKLSERLYGAAGTESDEASLMRRMEELAEGEGLREGMREKIPLQVRSQLDSKAEEEHTFKGDGERTLEGKFQVQELSADPADPPEGHWVTWMSDGAGSGDDGDIMVKIKAGGVVKTTTLVDFSAI